MSIALSSIGVRVYYTVSDNGTDPITGELFREIPEVKSIPSLSPAPDTLETTPLSNREYKTYINGLKDLGGALEFTANLTQSLLNIWNEEYVKTSDASITSGKTYYIREGNYYIKVDNPVSSDLSKYYELTNPNSVMHKFNNLDTDNGESMVLCIVHPKLNNAVYFPFEPSSLGMPEMAVNSVLEATLSITPIGEVIWYEKPEDSELEKESSLESLKNKNIGA